MMNKNKKAVFIGECMIELNGDISSVVLTLKLILILEVTHIILLYIFQDYLLLTLLLAGLAN